MSLGVNFSLPSDSKFGGYMLTIKSVCALHHDYQAPQMGMDRGLNFGWTMAS